MSAQLTLPHQHTHACQIDLAPFEHESRKLFALGILLGIVLQGLAVLLIPLEGIGSFENIRAVPFTVELLITTRPDMRPYVVRRPSFHQPQLVKKVPSRTLVFPPASTDRPKWYVLEPNTITGIIDNLTRHTTWEQAAKTLHDSLLAFDYLFMHPDTAIPIRNQLFTDTGILKTQIVFDPDNKQAIEGYAHFGIMWAPGLEPSNTSMLSVKNLANEVTRLTNIELVYDYEVKLFPYLPEDVANTYNSNMAGYNLILDAYNAGSTFAADYSFIIIPVDRVFTLSSREYNSIIMNNRFILVDNAGASYDDGQIDACIRQLGYKCQNKDEPAIEIRALPGYHPVYHSFYDFEDPPPSTEAPGRRVMNSIYGIYAVSNGQNISRRLIGIYTPQGYTRSWEDSRNSEQIKMGVNLITFALAQYDTEYDMNTGEWNLTSERRFLEK